MHLRPRDFHDGTQAISLSIPSETQQMNGFAMIDRSKWSTGLFDCFSDMETCCVADHILLGQQQKIVQGEDFCTFGCCCFACAANNPYTCAVAYACAACVCIGPNRQIMKQRLGIHEQDCAGECCCSVMCAPCVMRQMGRELKARGVYTTAGHRGETEKRNDARRKENEPSAGRALGPEPGKYRGLPRAGLWFGCPQPRGPKRVSESPLR